MRAFLSLGSNVGDRLAHLRRALSQIPDLVEVSAVYETEPVGGPEGQDAYLNAVAALETDLTPRDLLELCASLEEDAGRIRTVHDGPRTLDVDVLLLGELRVDEADLVIPHPRMWQRAFVVVPLAELAPDLVPPSAMAGAGGSVRRLGRMGEVEI